MIQLRCHEDLERLVMTMGFLPFFKNEIPNFSVEEVTSSEFWFSHENEGAWEWKGPVVRNGKCVYGKLFNGKAGFVSLDWFPELVNYRRYDHPILNIPGTTNFGHNDHLIYDAVVTHESLLSKEIKALCGFNTPRKKKKVDSLLVDEIESPIQKRSYVGPRESFEAVMTRLQMNTYLIIADFEYLLNRHQQPYGWGIARYTSPELLFGKSLVASCNRHSKETSLRRILTHLHKTLPQATDRQIMKLIGEYD